MSYAFANAPWFDNVSKSLHPMLAQIPFDALEQHRDALIAWAGEMAERDPKRASSYRQLKSDLRKGMLGGKRFAEDLRFGARLTEAEAEFAKQIYASLVANGGKHIVLSRAANDAAAAAVAFYAELGDRLP